MIYLGIDSDTHKSGIALWDSTEKKLLDCRSVGFYEVLHLLDVVKDQKGIAHIECGWLNPKSNFHREQGANIREKIAKNVGACETISRLFIQYCDLHNIRYRTIRPSRTKEQNNFIFKQAKWEGKSNQDCRDAAAMIIGL